jgi:hypothetical protein
MAAAPPDYRLIVVVRAAKKDAANRAARVVDTDPNAGDTFTVPLRVAGDPTNAVAAYWCSWLMMRADGSKLLNALKTQGFSNAEIGIVAQGAAPNMAQDLWVFDDDVWAFEDVLTTLGFARVQTKKP